MNNNIYQIKIKKEYAAAIIEDLKLMDAIEILESPIPKWQQEESLKRLASYQKMLLQDWMRKHFLKN